MSIQQDNIFQTAGESFWFILINWEIFILYIFTVGHREKFTAFNWRQSKKIVPDAFQLMLPNGKLQSRGQSVTPAHPELTGATKMNKLFKKKASKSF